MFPGPDDPTRIDPADIVRLQRRKLADMVQVVLENNAFYIRKFAGLRFDAQDDSFESLPFTTRGELQDDQRDNPPYGSNLTFPPDVYVRLHQTSASSGAKPLRWLDTAESWRWFKDCWTIIYDAAGVQTGDRLFFPFSFGPFVGFWAAFEAATARGCLTIAAGGLSTTARIRMILDNAVTVIGCTPTYALRMAEVAREEGIDLAASGVRALIVAGEPGGGIPATRKAIETAWGARLFDHTGMTEIGSCSFECVEAPGGVHVIETEFIAEVVDSETGRLLPDGSVGELVLTNLGRVGSPLIRYLTGDRVRMLRKRCACGRWFARLEAGILGRTDDMMIVRGNNVFPSAVEEVVRGFPITEFRVTATQGPASGELMIEFEHRPDADPRRVESELGRVFRDRFSFNAKVVAVAAGTLPRYEMKARRFIRQSTE
jgi:phenylacetate-CoA ligase